ncbi:MAG TPA: hypothetical protein VLF20_01965 [Patescibacteria group bacterium]|nr:hypothetical protein [Patescibacteria group bacterium]
MLGLEKFFERSYFGKNDFPGGVSPALRGKAGWRFVGGMGSAVGAYIATEGAKEYIAANNLNPDNLSPFEYGAIYHTGNELEGFFHAYASALVLDYLFPRMSNKLKIGVASSLSLASVVAAELKQISGVPDPADIPGGLLGIGLFVGTSLLARRIIKKGSNRQISKW